MKKYGKLLAVLVVVGLIYGCGEQVGAQAPARFVDEDGKAVSSIAVVTDQWSGCKYALKYVGNAGSMTILYDTDGKPLGCGEKK
ncbi:DUF6440 family protein [Tumebacillus flagellatus]|uniref:DUF6440 domain-containing protein n=1 Tax=Tumebacillus flagellatus TaxID=1157490 RepID=A0A074LLU1_9BACL|nr:DUF6440 family protein [Tumebacillus flagellatus]KEO80853.1 hypothetical protein EL26_24035 [Tumebacillus flagellatus]